ncbi:hypothetical protein EGW08_006038, partial [Elysia chlorotica]
IQVLAPLWPAIILFGLISNVINIIVFLKSGARDNVTILLLSLAVSDLAFLALISPAMSYFIISAFARSHPWPFDPRFVRSLFYWPAFTAYDLSAFISVSLGVMRCACVAMPLRFKFVFTRSRTITWVLFLVVLAVSLRIPVLSIQRVGWTRDPDTNTSSPCLKAVNMASMSHVNDIMNRGVVINVMYITMVTCVVVLTLKLYQASKIRRACTEPGKHGVNTPGNPGVQGLSTKDLQVVKSVVLVCSIFILSQLSFLVTSAVRLVSPEFDNGRDLLYLFGIISHLNALCSYLNASLNIFVYYNYNSKYRPVFCQLVCSKYYDCV